MVGALALAAQAETGTFKRIQITDKFWSEGADFGDFNQDGKMDVASGPFWYEGPDFKKRHEYRPATATFKLASGETIEGFEGALGKKNAYSDNFFTFVYDFNGDKWPDILIVGLPNKPATLFLNPKGGEGHWTAHQVFDVVDNESPGLTCIDGCGKPELICHKDGYLGYAKADWSDPTKPWTYHRISPKGKWHKYSHGLGIGDVNGDGRMDMLVSEGWWEQPASLTGDPEWKCHPFKFAEAGAQMYAYDVNGDGLNDVITAVHCHKYGLVWWEQVRKDGEISFVQHDFAGPKFSQPHAIALFDMNGDGLLDVVTGKRFWAHGPTGDPEPNATPWLFWYQLVRGPNRNVQFVAHIVDNDSGVGTQVVAGHISGKGKLGDIVVGNKKGTFVFLQGK
jgi:hypothetical protein